MSDATAIPAAHSRVVGDRYRLTRRLAVGGMGEVWVAIDELLDRRVAVKILREEFLETPLFLARFRAEAKHTASLTHPGVAQIFDYGEEHINGRCTAYLVMELVDGPALSDLLAARGPLPIPTTIDWLAQAAEALGAAHRIGVVHRDVKPGNVLVDGDTIKITDFGIARAMNSVPLTDAGQIVGTARYMSPEQATGSEATPASDVYSLGIVGYEMLTGQPPFTVGNAVAIARAHLQQQPPALPQHVPPALCELLARALAKDPTRRPADADAFARELRSFQKPATQDRVGALADQAAISSGSVHASAGTMVFGAAPTRTRIFDHDLTIVAPPSLPVNAIVADHHATKRSHRTLVTVTIVIAACIVLLAVTHSSTSRRQDLVPATGPSVQRPGASTAPDTTLAQPSIVVVDPATYLGMPVEQARQALRAVGFNVAALPASVDNTAVVAGVAPSGPLPRGSTVTLTVTTATTQPAAPSTTSPAPTRSKGNSNGNGKGKGK